MKKDVVVIGGGVIGLSIAWSLALRNLSVALVERSHPGSGATRAAAGMLAPLAESGGTPAFHDLGIESLRLWPRFAREVEEASGFGVELSSEGTVHVAETSGELDRLRIRFEDERACGLSLRWLDAEATRKLVPCIAPTIRGGFLSPFERHVDPVTVARALTVACARRGVEIVEGAAVDAIEVSADDCAAVSAGATIRAGRCVIAAGAWSGLLLDRMTGTDWWNRILFPVRGQIRAFARSSPILRHVIYSSDGYLVPRGGAILSGATEELAGFDDVTTEEASERLLRQAQRLVPGIEAEAEVSSWSGLRPGSIDRAPVIGPHPDLPHVVIAAGHFRSGILLAPVTGALVADLITQGDVDRLDPFRPSRFGVTS